MAHVLRIANAGATIIQYLSRNAATDPWLIDYTPTTPPETHMDYVPDMQRDGGERFLTTYQNVTESAIIQMDFSATTTMQSVVQNIEKIFERVRQWQNRRVGEPYYVQFSPHDYSGAQLLWRSELLSGRVSLGAEAISKLWGQKKIQVQVTWTRRFFWEDPTSTGLVISNGLGTTAAGASLNVNTDPASNNYVLIAAAQVTGSLPTPALMTIGSSTAGTNVGAVYAGLNVWSPSDDPDTFVHVIQAEASTSGGAAVADTLASGGNALDVTLPVTEAEIARFALSASTQLKEGAGRYFRAIARFAIVDTGGGSGIPLTSLVPFAVRMKVMSGTDVIWTGPEVIIRANYALRDIGIIQLPPAQLPFTEANTLAGLNLSLWGRSLSASTKVVSIDAIQLTPLDSYRTYEMAAVGIGNGRQLVDEPNRGLLYQQDTSGGSNRSNVFRASGTWLWLVPGKKHKIIFLFSLTDGTSPISRTVNIAMSYRPRRLTI